MTHLIDDQALVLRKTVSRDDYRIILFTKEHGKIVAMGKGTRSLLSKRSPHIQTSNYLKVFLKKHTEMWYLEQTELLSGFGTVKQYEEKVRAIYFYLLILDKMLPQEQNEERVFQSSLLFLKHLHLLPQKDAFSFAVQSSAEIAKQLGFPLSVDVPQEIIVKQLEDIIGEKILVNTV